MAKKRGAPKKSAPKKKAKTAKRARRPRPRKITPEEIDRKLEEARRAAKLRRSRDSATSRELAYVLEVLQDAAARALGRVQVLLKVSASPATEEMQRRALNDGKPRKRGEKWRPIWSVIGEFTFRPTVGYGELHKVFVRWSTKRIEKLVNPMRIARIVVVYQDQRGKDTDYTLGDATSWQLSLSRAKEQTDPTDDTSDFGGKFGSLAVRYDNEDDERSELATLRVWLAANLMKSRSV